MLFQILIALLVCAIIALQFWIVAKTTQAVENICANFAQTGLCIRHEYKIDTPTPTQAVQEDIDYEEDQKKVMDAAMALQELFLGSESEV